MVGEIHSLDTTAIGPVGGSPPAGPRVPSGERLVSDHRVTSTPGTVVVDDTVNFNVRNVVGSLGPVEAQGRTRATPPSISPVMAEHAQTLPVVGNPGQDVRFSGPGSQPGGMGLGERGRQAEHPPREGPFVFQGGRYRRVFAGSMPSREGGRPEWYPPGGSMPRGFSTSRPAGSSLPTGDDAPWFGVPSGPEPNGGDPQQWGLPRDRQVGAERPSPEVVSSGVDHPLTPTGLAAENAQMHETLRRCLELETARSRNSRDSDNRYVVRPEKFDPSKGQRVEEFLRRFVTIADWNRWGDEERGTQLLLSLAGPATQVTHGLPTERCLYYPVLVERLVTRFGRRKSAAVSKSLFSARVQRPEEGINSFAEALQTLCTDGYPEMESVARNEILLAQFQRGLYDPEVKKHVILKEPESFTDALRHAVQYGVMRSIVGIDRRDTTHFVAAQPAMVNYAQTGGGYGKPATPRAATPPPSKSERRGDSASEEEVRKCFTCGNTGHFYRDCALFKGLHKVDPKYAESPRRPDDDRRRAEERSPAANRREFPSTHRARFSPRPTFRGRKFDPRAPGNGRQDGSSKRSWSDRDRKFGKKRGRDHSNFALLTLEDYSDSSESDSGSEAGEDPAPITYPTQLPQAEVEEVESRPGRERRKRTESRSSPVVKLAEQANAVEGRELVPLSSLKTKRSKTVDFITEVRAGDGRLWYVPVTMEDRRVNFLLDCGSNRSLIHADLYYSMADRTTLLPYEGPNCGVTGAELKIAGQTEITVKVGGKTGTMMFIVAHMPHLVGIWGLDMFDKFEAVPDFKAAQLLLSGNVVPLYKLPGAMSCHVHVLEDQIVPADSEMILRCRADMKSIHLPDHAIVETSEEFSDKSGLLGAGAVVRTTEDFIPVRVFNVGDTPVKVRRGQDVGILEDAVSVTNLVHVDEDVSPDGLNEYDYLPEELQAVIDKARENIGPGDAARLSAVLKRHRDVFHVEGDPIGHTDLVEHSVDTGSARPVKQRVRPVPMGLSDEVDRQLDEMLEQGVIEPSSSPWSSPIVLVKKKNGKVRFCVDYRRLNELTVKDAYPLPRISETLDTLGGSRYFCCLDMKSGFWQVGLDEQAKEKSAFVTKRGLFQWNVMPFGMANAPATFERLMDLVLAGLNWSKCLVYMDDILVFGTSFRECLDNLDAVLTALGEANLRVSPEKCSLFLSQIAYLGHVLSAKGVQPDPTKVEKVRHWPVPVNLTEVRAFLGLASYYRRWIKDFATIAAPLHRLQRKDEEWKWTPACQGAFESLRDALCEAPVLSFPRKEGRFILDTDASKDGLGGTLSQIQDGEEKPVGHASKALSRAQRNYCTTHRELLGVVTMVQYYKHYLMGNKFTVRTDHGSLRWLMNFKEPEGMLARWLTVLNNYDYEIEHRAGVRHGNADALSRRPRRRCDRPDCDECEELVAGRGPPSGNTLKGLTSRLEGSSSSDLDEFEVCPLNARKRLVFPDEPAVHCNAVTRGQRRREEEAAVQAAAPPVVSAPVDTAVKTVEAGNTPMSLCGEVTLSPEVEAYLSPPRPDPTAGAGQVSEPEGETAVPLVTASPRLPAGDKPAAARPRRVAFDEMQLSQEGMPSLAVIHDQQEKDRTTKQFVDLKRMYGFDRPPQKVVIAQSKEVKDLVAQWRNMTIHNGLLYRHTVTGEDEDRFQLYLPPSIRVLMFYHLHGTKCSGHLGEGRMLPRVQSRFYWPGYQNDIKTWCSECQTCQQRKSGMGKARSPMTHVPATFPMERVHMDVLTVKPASHYGNTHILVVTDSFTRWTEAYPIPDQKAKTVAWTFVKEFVTRFGAPHSVHTDQHPDFEAALFQEIMRLFDIDKTRTSPYRPQSDGQPERFNRTLISMLAMFVRECKADWEDVLPFVMMAYRSTVHESTSCSPCLLMLGREIGLPLDITCGLTPDGDCCTVQYAMEMQQSLLRAHAIAAKSLKRKVQHQKRMYDRKSRPRRPNIGDWVWYYYTPNANKKLSMPWTGPYLVTEFVTDVNARIQATASGKPKVVHVDYLKPVRGPTPESWLNAPVINHDGENQHGLAGNTSLPVDIPIPRVSTFDTAATSEPPPRDVFYECGDFSAFAEEPCPGGVDESGASSSEEEGVEIMTPPSITQLGGNFDFCCSIGGGGERSRCPTPTASTQSSFETLEKEVNRRYEWDLLMSERGLLDKCRVKSRKGHMEDVFRAANQCYCSCKGASNYYCQCEYPELVDTGEGSSDDSGGGY